MCALPAKPQPVTEDEYLEFERHSDTKHEFIDGQVYAMAGASERHNLIVGNTYSGIHSHLRPRPCRVYPSDMRVKIEASSQYTYPDISGLCGEPTYADNGRDTLTNPLFIIEVLSPMTEQYDRGAKFLTYQRIVSLQDYVLVAQPKPRIEHFQREHRRWIYTLVEGLDTTLYLPSIDCTLTLMDVYEKVGFEA